MGNLTIRNFDKSISTTIVARGRQYFRSGNITKLIEETPGEWEATVRGTGTSYNVLLSLNGEEITDHNCECPSHWDILCKHEVAVLLKIRELTGFGRTVGVPTAIKVTAKPPRPAAELFSAYLKLPDAEQRLVKIVAIAWEPISQTKLFEIFNAANFKIGNKGLYVTEGKPMIENLLIEGFFLAAPEGGYQCPVEFSNLLCDRHWDKDADFPKLVIPIQRHMQLSYWAMDAKRIFREMRIGRYMAFPDVFKSNFNALLSHKNNTYTQETLCNYWLPELFDLAKTEILPRRIRAFLLSLKLIDSTFDLAPADGYFLYTAENVAKMDEADRPHLARLVAQQYLLRGNWKGVEKKLSYLDPVYNSAFTGIHQLLSGNGPGALDSFNLMQKALRKKTGSIKDVMPGLSGVFQVLAYLKAQDVGLYPKIDAHIQRCLKQPDTFTPLFLWLNCVLLFLKNDKKGAIKGFQLAHYQFPLFTFFKNLCRYWVDENLVDKKELKDHLELLQRNGYDWLASETLALLEAVAPEGREETLSEMTETLGTEPLLNVLPRFEEWENALKVLLKLGSSVSGKANQSGTRLAWLVDFEQQIIAPKEQGLNKSGWGRGKAVTFKRLKEQELTCMEDQDHRIVTAIGFETSSEFWIKNNPNAWRNLVGHPLLFLYKSPDVAVQFLETKPSLIAKETKKGYTLQFSHNVTDAGIQILKESPTRYVLVNVTEQMAQIARAFNGKALTIPEKGVEQLKAVVAGLSGILPVQSAFEDENLPSVNADARPCVHLLPVGDGFHVELFAKPFGEVPPYLRIGEGEPTITTVLEGVRTRAVRNLKLEKKNLEKLRSQVEILGQSNPPRMGVWELENSDLCLELLLQLQPLVAAKEIHLEWPKGEKFRITKIAGIDQFKMQVSEKNNWFEVTGELQVDEGKVLTMQELLALSQSNKQFIELSTGQFLALTEEFRRRLQEVDGLLSVQKKGGALQLHPLAVQAFEPFTKALKNFKSDKKFKESRKKLEAAFAKKFPVPKNFNASLRPYQQEGFEWLHRCAAWGVGACLADDMGLGKTIQALAFLTDRAGLGPALVVAPASVCRNWVAEVGKFAPALRAVLFGEGDRAAEIDMAGPGDLVIVTYDLMTKEASYFIQKQFATVILDEAQAIKNRATKRSETAMQIKGDFKMLMTGTPIENHLGELWNLFTFANPGLLGSVDSFNERFAIPIEKYQDNSRREQLRRLVQPFMLRRRKDEVLKDLPEKTEITLTVQMPPDERAFYEALRRSALEKLLEETKGVGSGEKHLRILAEIMRLRRASCHPKLVDENAPFLTSAKLRLFAEIVGELLENGHKALVFSQFVGHLSILEKYLLEQKIAYQYLDGSTPLALRQKRIEAFQRGEGDIFLISLKAGGVGLNLTAADFVIHTDPWWNPAVEDQATDRAHRIGQDKPVTVYRLVAENTIEEKILQLHEKKRDLADSLLEGADVSARLSADELLGLLSS